MTGKLARITSATYPFFLMGLLYAVFSWPMFSADAAINIFPDNESFLAPVFSFFSAAIRNLEIPLWMNTVLGGVPLYNSPQVSAYYPFYFVFLDVYRTPLESIATLHWITLFHLLVLLLNSFVLLRTLNISKLAAVFGATFIVFNLTTLEMMKWTHLIASYAWFPLYFAGLIRLLDTPRKISGTLMLVFGFALMAYAMVGQPLVLAGLLTGIIVVAKLVIQRPGPSVDAWGGFISVALALTVALLISAVCLFPVVFDLSGMIRWVSSDYAITGNAAIPFKYFITDQLAIGEISSFVIPGGQRHDIAHPYIGLLPLLFGAIALRDSARHWIILPLAFIAVYSFLSAFGENFGLANVNYFIPVVNKIREPSYFLIPFNFAVSALAAFGADSLIKRWVEVRANGNSMSFKVDIKSGGIVLFLAASYCAVFISSAYSHIFLLAIFFVTVYSAARLQSRYAGLSVGALCLFAIIFQLHTVTWRSPKISDSNYLRQDLVRLESAISRIAELDPNREYRVVFGGGINSQTAAMLASFHRVRTLNSYVNPLPLVQFNEMYYHGQRIDNYARALGAKFLLCGTCSVSETVGYRMTEAVGGYSIYLADDALPRSYITNNLAGRVNTFSEFITTLASSSLDALPLILAPQDVTDLLPAGERIRCVDRKESQSLNKIAFVIYCDKSGVFVLNEFFTDAWKVSVNGVAVQPRKVNGNQIGVQIGAGSSVIDFAYEPWSVRLSMLLFGAGCTLLVIFVFWMRRKDGLQNQH